MFKTMSPVSSDTRLMRFQSACPDHLVPLLMQSDAQGLGTLADLGPFEFAPFKCFISA